MTVLVCVIMQTRAHELTFDKFKENVLDVLGADLALCVSATPEERLGFGEDPFHVHAKYKYVCDEVEDFGELYDVAAMMHFEKKNKKKFTDVRDLHEIPDWRQALTVRDQLFGGIESPEGQYQHPGSAAIMLFFRWYLLQCLEKDSLIDKYDHFIVTRSDQYHELPHVQPSDDHILLPRGEDWYGLTDRHVVVPRKYVKSTLNLLDWILEEPEAFVRELDGLHQEWNPESYYLHHLVREGVADHVRRFRRTFYSVRRPDGPTRWSTGDLDASTGMMVKYPGEKKGVDETKRRMKMMSTTMRNDYGLWGPVDPRAWPPGIVAGFKRRGFEIKTDIPYIKGTFVEDIGEVPTAAASLHVLEHPCGGQRWSRKWSRELIDFMALLSPVDLSPAMRPDIAICIDFAFKEVGVAGKRVGVLNSCSPWVESLAMAKKARRVVSIGRIEAPESAHDGITTTTLEDFSESRDEKYDVLVAVHLARDGLGRDGEEIDPDGDKVTLSVLADALAPGGVIAIDLPLNEKSLVISNYERVYSDASAGDLFSHASLIPMKSFRASNSLIVLLRKERTKRETSFLTYGTRGYAPFASVLAKEASSIGKFETCAFNTESDLDGEFVKQNAEILRVPRGGGYWLWKPYIIFKRLMEMPEDSVLVYCDALYRITGPLSEHVSSYFDADPSRYVWLTKNKPGDGTYLESDLTKADAIKIVCHRSALDCVAGEQVWAGCVAFKKCVETMTMVAAWLTYCQDPRVLTSDPDVLAPKNSSRDNRHDQTVLSLLAKAARIPFHEFPDSLLVDLRSSSGSTLALREQELTLRHGDIPQDHEFGRVLALQHNFDHFRALQSIMATTYESWRGCGSYLIDGTDLGYTVTTYGKQCAMYEAAKGKSRALEIVVHGGHSLLIMLLANPRMTIEAIDICVWKHTRTCVEYLANAFPSARITLHEGASLDVLKNGHLSFRDFDIAHIDGAHDFEVIKREFEIVLPMTTDDAHIVFDNFETPGLPEAIMKTWASEVQVQTVPRCSFPNCVTRRLAREQIKKNL